MMLFLASMVLLFWAVRFHDLQHWGWWLAIIVLAWLLDQILLGAQRRAPRPPGVYGLDPAKPMPQTDVDARLEALRTSTRRTIEESDRVATECREEIARAREGAERARRRLQERLG